jgi:hypothetical protein
MPQILLRIRADPALEHGRVLRHHGIDITFAIARRHDADRFDQRPVLAAWQTDRRSHHDRNT